MTKLERELTAKVAQLEERVKALEARPEHVHHHYPPLSSHVSPSITITPPGDPFPWRTIWCGVGSDSHGN